MMPMIGWLFLLMAFGLVLGSLLMLRDSANKMPIDKEKLKRIKERQAELEAEEAKEAERKKD
ncbi:DUF2897 family protein [Pseudomonas jilinensis]